MKPTIPVLHSANAGYVDTAGFLALHGLFTAHVTGNFVTIGAALVQGTSGVVAKLLALPVFCAVVVAARLLHYWLAERKLPVFRIMLLLQFLLLAAGGAAAIWHGPFANGDHPPIVVAGMLLVAGMAVQNAVHRVHMANFPPTTLMTGSTTQIMLDIADRLHGVPADQASAIGGRLARLSTSVLSFAVGCAAGAAIYAWLGMWCFALPPALTLASYLHPDAKSAA